MQATTGVQFVVDTIMEATRRGTDASLRAGGVAMPPQAHLLVEQLEQPYLGYMTCRPIHGGRDITPALRGLGVMASLIGASRLVLAWENHGLWSEVEQSEAPDEPYAHVAVDVRRDGGHVLRCYPFEPYGGAGGPPGRPATVLPVWGEPILRRDGELPWSCWELLRMWREPTEWDRPLRTEILAQLEEGGYQMRWVRRAGAPAAARR